MNVNWSQSRIKPQLILCGLAWALSACNIIEKREVPSDPKSSADTSTKEPDPPNASMYLSSVTVGTTSLTQGGQTGITLSVRNTLGEAFGKGGSTVSFLFAGGTSVGSVSAVTDNSDGTYTATLTGVAVGTPSKLITTIDGSPLLQAPISIAVKGATATKLRIETAADGSGTVMGASTLTDGTSLTLYAVGRDSANNFIQSVTATWSESGSLGFFSNSAGTSTVYTPAKGSGMTTISASSTTPNISGSLPATTVVWTPQAVSGLVLWLKADALGSLSNGAAVSSWTDVSGLSNHATQGTGANQPTMITSALNGKPALNFNGTTQSLSVTHNASLAFTTTSIFVVAKYKTASAYATLLSKSTDGSFSDGFGLGDVTGAAGTTFGFWVNDLSTHRATVSHSANSTYSLLSGIYDKSNITLYRNGGVQSGYAYSTNIDNPTVSLLVGLSSNGTSYFTGEIAEILVYNTNLSALNQAVVENYLCKKYQLSGGTLSCP